MCLISVTCVTMNQVKRPTIASTPEAPMGSSPVPILFLPSKVSTYLTFMVINPSLFLILLPSDYIPLNTAV